MPSSLITFDCIYLSFDLANTILSLKSCTAFVTSICCQIKWDGSIFKPSDSGGTRLNNSFHIKGETAMLCSYGQNSYIGQFSKARVTLFFSAISATLGKTCSYKSKFSSNDLLGSFPVKVETTLTPMFEAALIRVVIVSSASARLFLSGDKNGIAPNIIPVIGM